MPQDIRREEELRKSKMVAEGGPVLAAYFNRDFKGDPQLKKEELSAKAMVSEGGLGAEVYYNDNQRIANIDVEQNKDDYVN